MTQEHHLRTSSVAFFTAASSVGALAVPGTSLIPHPRLSSPPERQRKTGVEFTPKHRELDH